MYLHTLLVGTNAVTNAMLEGLMLWPLIDISHLGKRKIVKTTFFPGTPCVLQELCFLDESQTSIFNVPPCQKHSDSHRTCHLLSYDFAYACCLLRAAHCVSPARRRIRKATSEGAMTDNFPEFTRDSIFSDWRIIPIPI